MKLLNFLRGEAFARGVHPPQHKDTAAMPISRLPFAPRLVVPLSQNVGRPARPVRIGKGQVPECCRFALARSCASCTASGTRVVPERP